MRQRAASIIGAFPPQRFAVAPPLRVLHSIHLANDAWGGMEKQFANLLRATRGDPRIAHYLCEDLSSPAAGVIAALPALAAAAQDPKRWHGMVVPNWRGWRQRLQAMQARRWGTDVVLSWNRFGDPRPVELARRAGAAAVYWERGAAWFVRRQPPGATFLAGFDRYLANSRACIALLRHWGVTAPVEVCAPGIWRGPQARQWQPRALASHRPLRLGFSARLQSFKGGVLAVHALKILRDRGLDADLQVAGNGPDLAAMQTQAARLGVQAQTRFLGRMSAMDDFLGAIDLLLHPALREPYGNSCAEALVAGVPVVAAAVDGLPEVVDDGVNGYCVIPTLPLADYAALGGDLRRIHPLVYRPELGRVAEAAVPDPQSLADAVQHIAGDEQRYAAFSSAAVSVARRFDFDSHVEQLLRALQAARPS